MKRPLLIATVLISAFALASGGGYISTTSAVSGLSASQALVSDSSGNLSSEAALSPVRGGTGVANNSAATFTRSGNHALTVTTSGTTGITLPTSGTLAVAGANGDITSLTAATTVTTAAGFAVHGTNTNDSAAAGYVGEAIRSAQTSFQSLSTSATFVDVTNIALTAGDWDVSGLLFYTINGATITFADGAISAFSANTTTDHVAGDNVTEISWTSGTTTIAIPAWRVSLSGNATIYLKAAATKSAGTPQAKGRISARRVR